jgi:hypothetical protein
MQMEDVDGGACSCSAVVGQARRLPFLKAWQAERLPYNLSERGVWSAIKTALVVMSILANIVAPFRARSSTG